MNIWILAKREKFDNFENIRFMEVAESNGIDLTLIAPDDCEIVTTKEGRKSLYIMGEPLKRLPDCVLPRTGSGTTYFASAVIRHFERIGAFVLNTADSIELAKDKLATIQALASSNVPMPKTLLGKYPLDLDVIDREFTFPVILKKIVSSMGKGVLLCQNRAQLEDVIDLVQPSSTNFIIQECIKKSLGKDIRVFVVGGRAIGAILRTAKQGSFKANYSAGGSVETFELSPEIEWLAIESARILGLDIAGVDLLFDKKGFRICEVNSSPFFEGFEEATGINVPEEIFQYINVRLSSRNDELPTPASSLALNKSEDVLSGHTHAHEEAGELQEITT